MSYSNTPAEQAIGKIRHSGTDYPFSSTDDLAEQAQRFVGESVSVIYQKPSGIQAVLYLDVRPGPSFDASYGPGGFPMRPCHGITPAALVAFLIDSASVLEA